MAITAEELAKLRAAGHLIIGTKRTLKALSYNELERVYLAANCPSNIAEDIYHYANLLEPKPEIIQLELNNDELGVLCKRAHFIAVLGVLKPKLKEKPARRLAKKAGRKAKADSK